MFKDTSFVITFQLALIGVVLIGGLFLIWKGLARVEEKLDMLMFEKDSKHMSSFREQLANAFAEPSRMTEVFDEQEVMQDMPSPPQVPSSPPTTGPLDQFVMFTSSCPFPTKVEEEAPPQATATVETIPPPSEADTTSEPLSKNKLRTMNLEKLKKICEEKKLDPEGTKNQLIERILAE